MSKELQKQSTQITSQDYWLELQRINIPASISIFEAVGAKFPAISSLNTGTGSRENGLTFFKLLVLDILEFYGKEWNPSQIDSVADTLFTEYYYWSGVEAKHFVSKLKAGHFQEGIENISSNYIVKAALTYDDELLQARKMAYDKKPNQSLSEVGNYVDPELVFKAIGDFKNMVIKSIDEEQVKEEKNHQQIRKEHELKILKLYCDNNGLDFETERKNLEV